MYKIIDVVELIKDIPSKNLKRGTVGTIVEILQEQPNGIFEVEFCNGNGETLMTTVLCKDDFILYCKHAEK